MLKTLIRKAVTIILRLTLIAAVMIVGHDLTQLVALVHFEEHPVLPNASKKSVVNIRLQNFEL